MVDVPTSIQDDYGLCDVVSVVVTSEDGTYLLVCPVKGKEVHWIFTATARSISWRLVARQLIKENLGIATIEETLIKIFNVWVPDDNNLHHSVFEVQLSIEMKKKLKFLNTKLKARWFTAPDIHLLAAKGSLRSLELIDYLPTLKRKQPSTTGPLHPEGFDLNLSYLSNDDGLIEIFEPQILVNTEGELDGYYDQLVRASNLHRKEQILVYREFLSLCFPNLLMTFTTFETFMVNFGWRQDLLPHLFHAADLCDRDALTFKDFLFILAACEPKTPHGARPAEIRCRYIFRFFDINKDNKLDYDEIKQMLIAICLARNMPVNMSSIERELDGCTKDLGLGVKAEMNLGQFMRSVGDLKFRGTSSLLRSPLSVIDFFMIRTTTSYSTIIDTAATQLFRGSHPKGDESASAVYRKSNGGLMFRRAIPGLLTLDQADKKDIFEICGHIAKVCKDGLKHMDVIDDVPFSKTPSVTDTFLKSDSIEIFNTRFAPNEILAGLRYFQESINANDLEGKKLGRKPKPSFNWGQGIALSVCLPTPMT